MSAPTPEEVLRMVKERTTKKDKEDKRLNELTTHEVICKILEIWDKLQ